MQTAPASLLFRDFRQSDLPMLAQAMGDTRVTRFYGLETHHTDANAIACEQLGWYHQLLGDGEGWWQAICVGANGTDAIGGLGVYDRDDDGDSAELGYWLLPGHWGRGIMKTALRQWLPGAFRRLALHSVVAYVEPGNAASSRLLSQTGFTLEGLLRDCTKREGRYVSLQRYSLLAGELEA
ncbi:ribosomal-protein-alanine N-acetyltransferase [Comamonas odontotermitis]|uniref:Ribosomal-protein-alanine N-acetyltransferase n=1 Tax=Comamonas odontotermitis TaxID=379895 RepID=A0ABR6RB80_9BURK|nr:GNAT family protein [Comamonas odontotermitis]MBB6576401.1 ribosomal-protein-alanine N-acetyltransferase [Comamonas odontotermitis]